MARYFNFFPRTPYYKGVNSTSLDELTNITARFGFQADLKNNAAAYYNYLVKDGDTPEIIASKIYGSPERHWIVLLFNDIIDPQFDWPMPYKTFIDFVDAKYTANGAANTTVQTGLAWSMSTNNVKSYYKIIKRVTSDTTPQGTTIEEKIEVDANTYANVTTSSTTYTLADGTTTVQTITKEKQTYYDYEMETNEDKRTIKLLKKDFVPDVEKEFKRVIKL